MDRMFHNVPGDLGLIASLVIPKTFKMVLNHLLAEHSAIEGTYQG